jgi:hypothetical protein
MALHKNDSAMNKVASGLRAIIASREEVYFLGGELRLSIGTQSRVIVGRRVEGRHTWRWPELGILKEPGSDVHLSEVMQLKKAPLKSQLIRLLHKPLEVDTNRVARASVKKGVLLRDIRPAGHCSILDVNERRAECHQNPLEIGHQTLEISDDLSAAAQNFATNSPLGILSKAISEGVKILTPDSIEVARVQLTNCILGYH